MRILYISADYGIPILGNKGGSVHVREMAKVFHQLGHEVFTITPRMDGDESNHFCGNLIEIQIPGYEREILQKLKDNGRGDRMEQALFKEIRSILSNRLIFDQIQALKRAHTIDLVYERFSLWNYSGVEAAKSIGVPHVLEVNAPLSIEQEKYRMLHLKSLANGIEDVLFEKTDAIIAVSKGVKEYIKRRGIRASKIKVIPNSVDPDLFCPVTDRIEQSLKEKLNIPAGRCVIGFLGSLKKWHGVEVMIDAMRQLLSLALDVHLLVVGDGPLRSWIEDAMRKERLHTRITMAGEIPYSDVPDYIRVMDIPIAPYLDIPEFYFSPIKIYEYMSTGKPPVTSRIGQIPEVVQEGKTGLLCTPGSPDDLVKKILFLMENPEVSQAIGVRARKWIIRNSSWRKNAEKVLTIAEELCQTNKRLVAGELLTS